MHDTSWLLWHSDLAKFIFVRDSAIDLTRELMTLFKTP